jgi:hypothetical protein
MNGIHVCINRPSPHGIESGHRIKSHEPEVLAYISGYMDRLVKEATDIKLQR